MAGDESRDLNLTVATLTQGAEKKIDVDRVLDYLDNPGNEAAYLKDWQQLRGKVAFLMRRLDVRLFELPPNSALAAIRLCGDDDSKEPLNLKNANKTSALDALSRTSFVRTLLGNEKSKASMLQSTDPQTANEYRRVQDNARRYDKKFNKALAEALNQVLGNEGLNCTITPEKQIPNGNLRPDILIEVENGDTFCLEPTWRTTGAPVGEEIRTKQNTLSVGHIQKYLLEKVLEYVKDLGLN